jgi:hypothetical protein
MTPDVSTPASLVSALALAVTTLAGVVVYLFRIYTRRNAKTESLLTRKDDDISKERAQWVAREAELEARADSLRADYEQRSRELADRYAQSLKEAAAAAREREDIIRREYADVMEAVSAEASKASVLLAQVLEKFYTRFVGPRGY